MSKKRRRGSKVPAHHRPTDRRGKATGGRVTAPKNERKGSTFTSGEQAIVVGKDGITHKITNQAGAKGEAAVTDALRGMTTARDGLSLNKYGRASNKNDIFEVFNIPEADGILREWEQTGDLPTKPDGTPKRVALRCDGGNEPMEPRIDELVAGLREDGNDHIADFIEAGHWFDAGDMTSEELAAQGYGTVGGSPLEGIHSSGLRQFQTCLLYTSPSPRDLSTSRMPSSA